MKTICVYHSRDLDGWMSAAIVKKWFIEDNKDKQVKFLDISPKISNCTTTIGFDIREIHFLGWDYGDKIPNLINYDKVIMCDISFPKEEMDKIMSWGFKSDKPRELIWIDHHISAIKQIEDYQHVINWKEGSFEIEAFIPIDESSKIHGVRNSKYAACELTWMFFFNEKMPELVRLLGRYDCFGHKGTNEEQKVLEFQYAARGIMSSYEECYERLIDWKDTYLEPILEIGKGIYSYLCTEAKQTFSKSFPIELIEKLYYDNGAYKGEKVLRKFLCVNQERFNPINFGIDYHKKGYSGFACFWYKDGKWMFSLYNDNGEVDCSEIAKQYGGGGHKGAAGFVIEDLTQIIK